MSQIQKFLRRGKRVVRTSVHILKGEQDDSTDKDKKVRAARREVRRLRSKLEAAEATAADLRRELQVQRSSVRHPDPRIALPDRVRDTITRVRQENLSYLSQADLEALARIVISYEQAGAPGLIIEAGTARGGSAIVLAAAKAPERPMKVYDVFGMIPPPGEHDGQDVHRRYSTIVQGKSRGVGGETYYGYRDNLYDEVVQSFSRLAVPVEENSVELVRGLFEDTIQLNEPVAFAHLDGDWYESTMTCLERIAPRLIPGGRIVLDDYYAWSGCRRAVDEYFADRTGDFHIERRAKVHVVRH
jgi:O-methyltransferase